MNKVLTWVKEELESYPGKAFLGCYNTAKQYDNLVEGKFLFPTYVSYCKRFKTEPVSYRDFSKKTIQACKDLGFENVEKGRTSNSIYLTNVRVKEIVNTFEYKVGGDIDLSNTEISRNSVINDPNQEVPEKTEETKIIQIKAVDNSLEKALMNKYVANLTKKSHLKRAIDKHARTIDFSDDAIEEIVLKFRKERNLKDPSYAFVKNKREHFKKCALKIKNKGLTIYDYKSLGISPRITPSRYKNTINSMNKFFRALIFKSVGDHIKEHFQMVLLDLYLVSCYTMVLLGLYPKELVLVGRAVKSGSIWEALRKEFVALGKENLYQKPYVKACFYSVIFSGGAKAMVDSILKHIRGGLGMTEKEFEATEFYEKEKYNAGELAEVLINLILFKSSERCLKKSHKIMMERCSLGLRVTSIQ